MENSDDARKRDWPELLTVDEAAELLRVNRKTLLEGFHSGEIPGGKRIGAKVIRFSRDKLLEWFRGQDCVSRSRRDP